jgi:hypothetical protein
MPEQRSRTRASFRSWVEITAEGRRQRAFTVDLSTGGLGVSLRAPLQPGSRVVAEFPLPGIELPLELASRVVWCDPRTQRAGLYFLDVDPGLAELLESHVTGRLG